MCSQPRTTAELIQFLDLYMFCIYYNLKIYSKKILEGKTFLHCTCMLRIKSINQLFCKNILKHCKLREKRITEILPFNIKIDDLCFKVFQKMHVLLRLIKKLIRKKNMKISYLPQSLFNYLYARIYVTKLRYIVF